MGKRAQALVLAGCNWLITAKTEDHSKSFNASRFTFLGLEKLYLSNAWLGCRDIIFYSDSVAFWTSRNQEATIR